MKNVIVKIEAKTSQVFLNKKTLGINGENLQGEIIFEFTDEFVNGVAWLEVQMPNGEKGYLECTKNNDTYTLPILSSLLTEVGNIEMQLRITENEDANGIPVFKSNKFYLEVKEAINSTQTIPEEYPSWLDIANSKLNEIDEAISQIDNIDIIGTKEGTTTTITITNKEGQEESFDIYDGDDYILTQEDKEEIVDITKPLVEADIQPTLESNLEQSKAYADSIKPTKTSELTNDSNFAKTNQNNNFSTSQTVNGTLTINGDIVQNGASYETHAEQIYTEKDEIITRDGAVGGLSQGQLTGIKAKKYDGTNDGQLGFDANGEARVGDVGDTQPLLTRDEITNLTTGQVLVWDGTNLKAIGSNQYVKNTDVASITKFGVIKAWTSTNADGENGLNISTEV